MLRTAYQHYYRLKGDKGSWTEFRCSDSLKKALANHLSYVTPNPARDQKLCIEVLDKHNNIIDSQVIKVGL